MALTLVTMAIDLKVGNNKMHALIDGDRLPYAFGGFKDDEGFPAEWWVIQSRVDDNIKSLLESTQSTSYTIYLTSDDKSNFRFAVGTILSYKGTRSADKPFWYEQIRRYLVSEYKAEVVYGMEADDYLGIQGTCSLVQSSGPRSIICSVDKDLDLIPGLHYNELNPKKGVYELSEIDCQRAFYCQLLTGDSVDNIPGLYGVGKSSALCKRINQLDSVLGLYVLVRDEYEKRFGSYWKQFMWENAQLLWILRTENKNEVLEKLEELESQRLNCAAA